MLFLLKWSYFFVWVQNCTTNLIAVVIINAKCILGCLNFDFSAFKYFPRPLKLSSVDISWNQIIIKIYFYVDFISFSITPLKNFQGLFLSNFVIFAFMHVNMLCFIRNNEEKQIRRRKTVIAWNWFSMNANKTNIS